MKSTHPNAVVLGAWVDGHALRRHCGAAFGGTVRPTYDAEGCAGSVVFGDHPPCSRSIFGCERAGADVPIRARASSQFAVRVRAKSHELATVGHRAARNPVRVAPNRPQFRERHGGCFAAGMAQANQVEANYASAGVAPSAEHHFFELLHEFDNATVITRARTGSLHGRPMAVAQVESDGTLWFITGVDSPKVLEVREDSRALISLQNSRQFVTMNGHLELVADRSKVDELWKEPYRIWFDGKSDPEIVLLRFTPLDAEYWDNAGAHGIRHAFEAAKAYLKGEKVKSDGDPEAHAKVVL
jgi:general stress protein 26